MEKILKSISIDEVMPITQDFRDVKVKGHIWRINIGNIPREFSPTGAWGYVPLAVRYKTEERAKEVRLAILREMYNVFKGKHIYLKKITTKEVKKQWGVEKLPPIYEQQIVLFVQCNEDGYVDWDKANIFTYFEMPENSVIL